MEPIPLRTLITLLNYERMISYPKFDGEKLIASSFAGFTDRRTMTRNLLACPLLRDISDLPMKLRHTNYHIFMKDTESSVDGRERVYPSTACEIHPQASAKTKDLSFAQRELIYHESRGHDSSKHVYGLFQLFFELLPPEQLISIRFKNEDPVLVKPSSSGLLEFFIYGPKLLNVSCLNDSSRPPEETVWLVGDNDAQRHYTLAFSTDPPIVVDMARMKYGEAVRGGYGEYYFLGDGLGWLASMNRVCRRAVLGHDRTKESKEWVWAGSASEVKERFRVCAEKAWKRWQNREVESWCDICGKGGELLDCGGCSLVKVRYCCEEHRRAGWDLHRFTCERYGMTNS